MADRKITELGTLASPEHNDVLPIVDVSAGVTYKATVQALLDKIRWGRSSGLGSDHSSIGIRDRVAIDTNSVGFGCALFLASDGNFDEADASGPSNMPCIALALESGTGSGKEILYYGLIRDDSWAFTPGGLVFVSTTSGGLTQTRPSAGGEQVQIVGMAKASNILLFNPNLILVELA